MFISKLGCHPINLSLSILSHSCLEKGKLFLFVLFWSFMIRIFSHCHTEHKKQHKTHILGLFYSTDYSNGQEKTM